MSRLDGVLHRLRVLVRGERYADEVARELRFHRDLDELAAMGDSLGNETYYREEVRRMTLTTWLDRIRQDVSYAFRGLRRSPGFTAAVVLTLGLGVGVNGAMFSLLSRLFMLPPSGVERPNELRRVYATFDNEPGQRITIATLQYPQYAAMRDAVDSSIVLGIFIGADSTAMRDGNARVPTMVDYVNPDYFRVLGVRASRGRLFTADENHIASPTPVAVLSDAYWRKAFGADLTVIGREVRIDRQVVTIVGIAAPDFTGVDVNATDLWLPANTYAGGGGYNDMPWYRAFGASFHVVFRPRTAADEQRVLIAGTNAVRPVNVKGWVYDSTITLTTGPILSALGPGKQSSDMIVANRIVGVVVFVLIIAAANIMNLLLLRTAQRRREIAVRRALGVSRGRLFEQIATEAVILAIGGSVVALVFAFWTGTALQRLILPRVHWPGGVIDGRTTTFVVATSIVVALATAVLPSLEAGRTDLTDSLTSGSRQTGRRTSRLRTTLLVVQTALCVVLLVGAGLFLRSVQNVTSIDLGFDFEDRLFFSAAFDDASAHATELGSAIPEAVQRLRQVDGVIAAAYMDYAPIAGYSVRPVILPGHDKLPQLADGERGPTVGSVSPSYFAAVGVPLLMGRDFTTADSREAASVAIVSQRLAKLYWPNENPLGKCVQLGRDAHCTRIVGVVGDTHRMSIIEKPATQMYLPIAQTTSAPRQIAVHVRPGREVAVTRAADEILRSLVTDPVLIQARRFADVTRRELRPWRLGATLFTALGILALAVAAVGIYSVVAYGVSQRTHEMGVRIALGARRADIVDLVLSEAVRVAAFGAALGIVVSLAMGRLIASLLFGITPANPVVLAAAGLILGVVAAIAALIPAWRASSVNPVNALRAE